MFERLVSIGLIKQKMDGYKKGKLSELDRNLMKGLFKRSIKDFKENPNRMTTNIHERIFPNSKDDEALRRMPSHEQEE